ncbi:MAG: helix-turn-helix transcriptional regulator [Bacilli bacterium]|nr:helix-turn-helix transcriptional regulator [Bacilli bacterium]
MKKLKELRKENKFSCELMAKKLNITKPFYWQIENRKRRLSYDMAIRIAEVFKMKPDDIFYDDFKNKD